MRSGITLACACLLALAAAAIADDDESIRSAETAAHSWLELADDGESEETWHQASSLFQAAVTQAEWARALSAARGPLRELVARKLASAEFYLTLPGAPDGEYVVLTFDSVFTKKAAAVETVTVMKEADGSWRVSGYFIR